MDMMYNLLQQCDLQLIFKSPSHIQKFKYTLNPFSNTHNIISLLTRTYSLEMKHFILYFYELQSTATARISLLSVLTTPSIHREENVECMIMVYNNENHDDEKCSLGREKDMEIKRSMAYTALVKHENEFYIRCLFLRCWNWRLAFISMYMANNAFVWDYQTHKYITTSEEEFFCMNKDSCGESREEYLKI